MSPSVPQPAPPTQSAGKVNAQHTAAILRALYYTMSSAAADPAGCSVIQFVGDATCVCVCMHMTG